MRMPDPATPTVVQSDGPPQVSRLQRKCAQCEEEQIQRQPMDEKMEEEEESTLQTKEAAGQTPQITPAAQARISGLQGGGAPLPASVRNFFEPRFGHDFSQVRIHTYGAAAESAREVNAMAYTMGRDIVFGQGHYAPDAPDGRRLLAHELTHTLQQSAAGGGYAGAASVRYHAPQQSHCAGLLSSPAFDYASIRRNRNTSSGNNPIRSDRPRTAGAGGSRFRPRHKRTERRRRG